MLYATLVLLNGNIHTLCSKKPKAEAIAIFGEKIIHVGKNSEVKNFIGSQTKIIDLDGKTVLPGFTDCHVHLTTFGKKLKELDFRNATSIEEIQEKIKEKAEKTSLGEWIVGYGWDHEKFVEKCLPTRYDLDQATTKHPVVIFRVCGHLCVVNSKALEICGITNRTFHNFGKQIDRKPENGEPTGILFEKALKIIKGALDKPSFEERVNTCLLACRKAVEAGLTSVHWIIESSEELKAIQFLYRKGKLPLRVYILFSEKMLDHILNLGLTSGFGNSMLKIGGLKLFADGSLGARTAALFKPYEDNQENNGMLIYSQTELNELVLKAHKAGLQVAVHAIGDRAVNSVLDAFENALKTDTHTQNRHRIEHASVLNEKLIERIKKLNIIVSAQPHFIVSDFWIKDRLGEERAKWTYPLKSLLEAGIVVCGGSDCPVEPISPLLGIWACTAKFLYSRQRLTVDEAIRLYTVNAAYASNEEKIKGTIEEGKLADLTVLSEDPFKIEPEKIKDIEVAMTIVGGKIVYSKEKLDYREIE